MKTQFKSSIAAFEKPCSRSVTEGGNGGTYMVDHRPSMIHQRKVITQMKNTALIQRKGKVGHASTKAEPSSGIPEHQDARKKKVTSNQVIQRVVHSNPFWSEENQEGSIYPLADRFFLYGLSEFREVTYNRLSQNQDFDGENKTINGLNNTIGLVGGMFPGFFNYPFKEKLFWIRIIRRALRSEDAWMQEVWDKNDLVPNKGTWQDVEENDLAIGWLRYLIKHKKWIGLEDLGKKSMIPAFFKSKIDRRGRFGKNIAEKAHHKKNMRSDKMRDWLEQRIYEREITDQKAHIMRVFGIADNYCLENEWGSWGPDSLIDEYDEWLKSAFFRRVSKLGLRYARKENIKVAFNTASLKGTPGKNVDKRKSGVKERANWGPMRARNITKKMRRKWKGIAEPKDEFKSHHRPITVSEYREYQRLWWRGKSPRVKTYAEWDPNYDGYR